MFYIEGGGTEILSPTDGHTHRSTYRGGAHLKMVTGIKSTSGIITEKLLEVSTIPAATVS